MNKKAFIFDLDELCDIEQNTTFLAKIANQLNIDFARA
jgi:hypothetical protein